MTFVIEKNIPVSQQKRAPKYPFHLMENGDSFIVPIKGGEVKKVSTSLYNAARMANVRITTRTGTDHVRVWKIDTLVFGNND